MQIETRIDILEINGENIWTPTTDQKLSISNHWNMKSLVVITLEGKRITVSARELEQAVQNAINHG